MYAPNYHKSVRRDAALTRVLSALFILTLLLSSLSPTTYAVHEDDTASTEVVEGLDEESAGDSSAQNGQSTDTSDEQEDEQEPESDALADNSIEPDTTDEDLSGEVEEENTSLDDETKETVEVFSVR